MTTIERDLLTSKGTMDALLGLAAADDPLVVSAIADLMNTADGTARNRLDQLAERGLVDEDAAIVDNRPVRVYSLNDNGMELAKKLESILTEYAPKADDEDEAESAPTDTDADTEDATTDEDVEAQLTEVEPEAE